MRRIKKNTRHARAYVIPNERANWRKAVCIVDDPEKISLLADFTREEILQLLSERPMTEAQLSKEIGMTRAAIGYHLKILKKAQLIYLVKAEAEEHGILQKFYSPIAALTVVAYDRIPNNVKRYFIQRQIVQLRGAFIAFQLHRRLFSVSPATLEKLAVAMLEQLEKTARRHERELWEEVMNAESVRVEIYAEAILSLLKMDDWRTLLKEYLSN